MNIQILDSWLRDYLKTKATAAEIAEKLSLASVSVEKVEKHGDDYIYDIEITTNRPDLMSVIGIAREASAVLPQFDIPAKFTPLSFKERTDKELSPIDLKITNDSKLVNRICAVTLDINLKPSPKKISDRVEASDIRSINNAVDITNYVMREIGHPMHVFDYEKLMKTGKMIIRESKKGEKILTLDDKEYELRGGDIVADDGTGDIIDLLGVMGTLNSAVSDTTRKVMLFVDNNDHHRIRKTSMSLGIRTQAAVLNEKGVDSEAAMGAILRGVELLEEIADAKVTSKILDIYPNKQNEKTVSVSEKKINSLIGIDIPLDVARKILIDLGFETEKEDSILTSKVPSYRLNDIEIPEDLIEEIARVYGYFNLPSILPYAPTQNPYQRAKDKFYFENLAKQTLMFLGGTEVYTYPMVSEDMLEESPENSVTIKNPLSEDHVYMRRTLVPSLLAAVAENKNRDQLFLFEIANVYIKSAKNLPDEKSRLAGVHKKNNAKFVDVKGIIEALLQQLGINNLEFKTSKSGGAGADIYIGKDYLGDIEVLEENLIDFELDFDVILKHVNLSKIYKPISKFPESVEDLRFEIDDEIPYDKIVKAIREQSEIIKSVSLLDVYQNKKTFRIIYQSQDKNLTAEDITAIREKIIASLKTKFKAVPA